MDNNGQIFEYSPESLKFWSKRSAFTLAEVLITLGIIGIVAAMTIPTLIQKHEERTTVVKVKKMFSTLSQAYLMNKAKDEIVLGQTQAYNNVAALEVANVFKPYLRITKDCGFTDDSCIYPEAYKFLKSSSQSNDKYGSGGYSAYKVLLHDGSSIWFRRMTDYKTAIFYDTNGPKEPNTYGKDLFRFIILNDRVIPEGAAEYDPFDSGCAPAGSNGKGCAAWVVYKGNMEYLHCDDLSWNGKQKCSD